MISTIIIYLLVFLLFKEKRLKQFKNRLILNILLLNGGFG
jgi:hypothetical protein